MVRTDHAFQAEMADPGDAAVSERAVPFSQRGYHN
jgi:hypothetical protein